MTERNDKADAGLHPNISPLHAQLTELDNQLYRLTCVLHFHHSTLQASLAQETGQPDPQWLYGLSLLHDWLDELGQTALGQLEVAAKRVVRE